MKTAVFWVVLIHLIFINGEPPVYDCDSDIFCYGEILHNFQVLDVFKESKKFFYKKLKIPPRMVHMSFSLIERELNAITVFAEGYFENYHVSVCPTFQTQGMPNLQENITNEIYQQFALRLSAMWSILAIETNEQQNQEYHAFLYLPNCFIKANDFTPTIHYFDSYWILRGLLANGLKDMATGILRNHAYLINQFGYVSHSNQVYSRRRTQLPLLAIMMENYLQFDPDNRTFLLEMLPAMEKEFDWWEKNRCIDVHVENEIYVMFHYDSQVNSKPRPEEYKMDYELAKNLNEDDRKKDLYSALHALDESGFGFSNRFIRDNYRVKKTRNEKKWLNLDVSSLIPVELNSVMEKYAYLLGDWNEKFGDKDKGHKYKGKSATLEDSIDKVLWNKEENMWFDWDIIEDEHRKSFSITNLMPLFTFSYDEKKVSAYAEAAVAYLKKEKIIDIDNRPVYYIIPTSLKNSGEIWDYPFGLPSLNLFVIEGLIGTDDEEAFRVALELSRILMKTCYESYTNHNTLFKQYSALQLGSSGFEASSSNSVVSVSGYASTNGALLALFKGYGTLLSPIDYSSFTPPDPIADNARGKKKEKPITQREGNPKSSFNYPPWKN